VLLQIVNNVKKIELFVKNALLDFGQMLVKIAFLALLIVLVVKKLLNARLAMQVFHMMIRQNHVLLVLHKIVYYVPMLLFVPHVLKDIGGHNLHVINVPLIVSNALFQIHAMKDSAMMDFLIIK
jgi:hypothetical protein